VSDIDDFDAELLRRAKPTTTTTPRRHYSQSPRGSSRGSPRVAEMKRPAAVVDLTHSCDSGNVVVDCDVVEPSPRNRNVECEIEPSPRKRVKRNLEQTTLFDKPQTRTELKSSQETVEPKGKKGKSTPQKSTLSDKPQSRTELNSSFNNSLQNSELKGKNGKSTPQKSTLSDKHQSRSELNSSLNNSQQNSEPKGTKGKSIPQKPNLAKNTSSKGSGDSMASKKDSKLRKRASWGVRNFVMSQEVEMVESQEKGEESDEDMIDGDMDRFTDIVTVRYLFFLLFFC
jgi:hypothetical protein